MKQEKVKETGLTIPKEKERHSSGESLDSRNTSITIRSVDSDRFYKWPSASLRPSVPTKPLVWYGSYVLYT